MPLPSPFGRRSPRAGRNPSRAPLDDDRARLSRELEEIQLRETELRKKQEEMERRVADLPKQIEERERRQREMVRLRALATATDNVFGRPRDKRHSPGRPTGRAASSQRRMTRPEERSARLQFLFLCAVLAVILMLLWKSLP